ncbi:MAG: helix-turn-helix domain-containing protein [Granulosicoccus sp.]
MTSADKDWVYTSNQNDLERYQQDEIDLSSSINAGQRVSDLRNLADVSVQELSECCGISVKELLALESGLMQLTLDLAKQLSQHLGVEYSYLYVDSDNQR